MHRFFAYALILTLVGSLFSIVLPAVPSHALHENITINIDDDATNVYEPEDSVTLVGTIKDVQEDEDVTIKVLNADGGQEDDDDITPDEDDGYFDYIFNIPDDADGGIWTIEAEYDGDKVYTYFMVEFNADNTDEIELDLDQSDGIYASEDTVEIDGTVPDPDDEEIVEIIVLGPVNPDSDELIDDGEAELDDDEFTFEFDLGEDHGRYAIIVTYDGPGDQRGMAIAEIPDEEEEEEEEEEDAEGDSSSDGDLSAEILEATYEPGTRVTVQGTIDDYDEGDNIDLEIVIEDPEGDEVDDYGDDSVTVEDNGDFEYDFDLEDDADEGTYTVIITYDDFEVELEFEVEEDGGGGSGGSSDITVKLNKSSYLAGETMTVSGTVDEVADEDEGELLSIFLYKPEGQVILEAGSSKYVTPSSSGSYSATILIPSDLEEDDEYTVKVSYLEETVEANFAITGVSSTPGDEISVETDEDEYEIGQTVKISGEVPDTMIVEGQQILIRVNKPDGNPCRIDPIALPASGSFTYELVLGGTCGVAGEYDVEVTYGDNEADTSFEVIGSSSSSYSLNVEGDTYPIEYELSGGAINSMFVRPTEDKLVITLAAEENGQLTVVLPREVIDAIEGGEDIDYVVTIEDAEGNISTVDVQESENTDDARTLVIDYPAGAERIEIAGTQVVPEFGAVAAITMAVAIVGIIVATAKFGNKFSLFRQ